MKTRPSRLLLLLAATALVWTPLAAHAQGPQVGTPPGLTLTPAQQARAQARQKQFSIAIGALQADKSMTPAQKTAKAKALYQQLDADMLAILTPAERARIVAQRKSVTDKQAGFRKAHQAEIIAGSALAAKLNKSLTPAQKTQIADISKQIVAEGQSLNADKTLSPQAKQQKVQQDAQAKIMAILTLAQQTDYLKMQQMRKQLQSEAGAMQSGR